MTQTALALRIVAVVVAWSLRLRREEYPGVSPSQEEELDQRVLQHPGFSEQEGEAAGEAGERGAVLAEEDGLILCILSI